MARAKDHLPVTGPELYEQDFALWIEEQVELLRTGALDRLDLPNLIDEIESMGRSDRRKIENNLVVIIKHLLKYEFQPAKRSRSWLASIREHRRRVLQIVRDSPSLRGHLAHEFPLLYPEARAQAITETGLSPKRFPEAPPWTLEQVLDPDFLPG
jgi:hypothetical protein